MSPAVLLDRRTRAFRVLLVLIFGAMVFRLVQVQGFGHAHYATLSKQQTVQTVAATPTRGSIYDRNADILAETVTRQTVVADHWLIKDLSHTALALAPILQLPATDLEVKLAQHAGFIYLAHRVSDATAASITKLALPGINLVPETQRVVPVGRLAQSVVGTVDWKGDGNSGLELQFQNLLSGATQPGTHLVSASRLKNGTGIELTLDSYVQYVAEQALGAEIVASHATGGTAMVMDVRSGEILAMANLTSSATSPTSSTTPGAPGSATTPTVAAADAQYTSGPTLVAQSSTLPKGVDEGLANAALTGVYEPGSVFKLVTFSSALTNGVVTPTTPIQVPASIKIDKYTFQDAEAHGAETLTSTQVLAQSSNLGTIMVARALGRSRLLNQVGNLGFGQLTGLGFPGESPGIVPGPSQWTDTSIGAIPIGQGISVTAQQVLDAYNAVANGGVFVNPKLVRATVDSQGQATRTTASAKHRVIDPATNGALVSMLEQVVSQGTGTAAAVDGYTVAGKTGTAQIPGPHGYVPGAYTASFVGFAPAEHPVLSAMVILSHPTPIYGGAVAAPVFSTIMSHALHHYGIPTTSAATASASNSAVGSAANVTVPAGARTEGA